MVTKGAVGAIVVMAMVVVAAFAIYEFTLVPPQSPCQSLEGGSMQKTQTSKIVFGAVTEYRLPGGDTWPNAITTAPDGSVWFVEQELPGVAHLFPGNGTLVEYPWPGYQAPKPPDCVAPVSASGIALWNGGVWAADEFGNAIVGVNPSDGSALSVNATGRAEFPYWLAVGPDGALWFTSNNLPGQPTRLGRILPNMTLDVIDLVGLGNDQPLQLDFVNSTFALISTLNEATNSTTHSCTCDGHIYSFDPGNAASMMTPVRIGGDHRLILPTGVTYSSGAVWVAQHGTSSLAAYNLTTESWRLYPTSLIGFLDTTLPLQVQASNGAVWFNEHYANKIGLIDPGLGTLTEYSETDPPISNTTQIQNDLSIAATPGGAWFTSMSGNYVGYVDRGYDPGFHVTVMEPTQAEVLPGGNASYTIHIAGSWSSPLKVSVSDSENPQSTPKLISIVPSTSLVHPGTSFDLQVIVSVGTTPPQSGEYTVGVTVTNGDIQETAYVYVNVASGA